VARDRTGLVHFAVPLVLGEHPLGALVAGQVFDQYAEQLPLEQVARQLGLSPAPVWPSSRAGHLRHLFSSSSMLRLFFRC